MFSINTISLYYPLPFYCGQTSPFLDPYCYPRCDLVNCSVVPFVWSLFIYMNIYHESLRWLVYLFIYFNHYGLCILTTCTLPYLSICFGFHDSMHLGYDAVITFSLSLSYHFHIISVYFFRFSILIQFVWSVYSWSIPFNLFLSLIFCDWTFILRLPVILFSFQYFSEIIP